ncbi:MAG: type II toxin-antitoxin system RelE/ParE family toxin [Bryobacterales bacterium]|nr:type II toxin-antitoxin system RelE/ParE family toxin [Bryobacterales bacterium]
MAGPKPATDDLTGICDYTEGRFGSIQARRAASSLYDAASSLRNMPFCGRTGRKQGR